MSEAVCDLLVHVALWWSGLFCSYAVILLGVDALLVAMGRGRHRDRASRFAQAQIDRDAAAAVHRIGAAFIVAQRLIRDEGARPREARR